MNESFALAPSPHFIAPNNFRAAKVLSIHDGDSPHGMIYVGVPGTPLGMGPDICADNRWRMAYINAPEMSTPQGQPAKQHLESLCELYGCFVKCTVEVLGKDNYGRSLVVIYGTKDGQPINLNQKMLDDGFAVRM